MFRVDPSWSRQELDRIPQLLEPCQNVCPLQGSQSVSLSSDGTGIWEDQVAGFGGHSGS